MNKITETVSVENSDEDNVSEEEDDKAKKTNNVKKSSDSEGSENSDEPKKQSKKLSKKEYSNDSENDSDRKEKSKRNQRRKKNNSDNSDNSDEESPKRLNINSLSSITESQYTEVGMTEELRDEVRDLDNCPRDYKEENKHDSIEEGGTMFFEATIGKDPCELCNKLIDLDDNLSWNKCKTDFCSKCISKYVDKKNMCPHCKENITMEDLIENKSYENRVKSTVEAFKQYSKHLKAKVSVEKKQPEVKAGYKCDDHDNVTKMICLDCKVFIWEECIDEGTHEKHRHKLFERVFNVDKERWVEVRDNLTTFNTIVNKDLEEIMKIVKFDPDNLTRIWDDLVSKVRDKLYEKIEEIKPSLKEIEKIYNQNKECVVDVQARVKSIAELCNEPKSIETFKTMHKKSAVYKKKYPEKNKLYGEFLQSLSKDGDNPRGTDFARRNYLNLSETAIELKRQRNALNEHFKTLFTRIMLGEIQSMSKAD